MQKQLLRSLARSGRSALLDVLYNGTKMKRNISVCSAVLQKIRGHAEGQQPLANSRAYSLAVAAQATSNSEASKLNLFLN